jgi:hypothetical protein
MTLLIALHPIAAEIVNSMGSFIFSDSAKMSLRLGKSGKRKSVAMLKHDREAFISFYVVLYIGINDSRT